MVLPPALIDPATDGEHAQSDRLAILFALPVLFPMETRELLMSRLREKKMSLQDIADLVALPLPYVAFVVSDQWPTTFRQLTDILKRRAVVPDRVFTLDGSQRTMEVHSVPLESDPYMYAKRLEERDRAKPTRASAFVVETLHGRRIFKPSELVAYVPRNAPDN
jgi:DNA-binding transcriptional ArsR family regulator